MNWKDRYNSTFIPKVGMLFTNKPTSDKSGWEEYIEDPEGTEYVIDTIDTELNTKNPIMLKTNPERVSWSINEDFLKEHFIMVGEK